MAALIYAPVDISGVIEGMKALATDTALRTNIVARGRKRAAGFTWERAASETLAVYQSLAAPPTT